MQIGQCSLDSNARPLPLLFWTFLPLNIALLLPGWRALVNTKVSWDLLSDVRVLPRPSTTVKSQLLGFLKDRRSLNVSGPRTEDLYRTSLVWRFGSFIEGKERVICGIRRPTKDLLELQCSHSRWEAGNYAGHFPGIFLGGFIGTAFYSAVVLSPAAFWIRCRTDIKQGSNRGAIGRSVRRA